MNLPASCKLGKRVFKKLFHENADLSVADRNTFTEDIDNVIWQYTLKPDTLPVKPYTDAQREYTEIAMLEVILKTQRRTGRIAEIIHRAIPYPVFLVFTYNNPGRETTMAIVSLAHKRFSQAEMNAIVSEEIIMSEWINLSEPSGLQQTFLDSLNLSKILHTHFYQLYNEWYECVMALNCSRLTGTFSVKNGAELREQRKKILAHCRDIEIEIAELRTAIKKEVGFSTKVGLNTKIKQLEESLGQESAQL